MITLPLNQVTESNYVIVSLICLLKFVVLKLDDIIFHILYKK